MYDVYMYCSVPSWMTNSTLVLTLFIWLLFIVAYPSWMTNSTLVLSLFIWLFFVVAYPAWMANSTLVLTLFIVAYSSWMTNSALVLTLFIWLLFIVAYPSWMTNSTFVLALFIWLLFITLLSIVACGCFVWRHRQHRLQQERAKRESNKVSTIRNRTAFAQVPLALYIDIVFARLSMLVKTIVIFVKSRHDISRRVITDIFSVVSCTYSAIVLVSCVVGDLLSVVGRNERQRFDRLFQPDDRRAVIA